MQASVNERELVLDMLLQITRDGEYSHIVIKNVLDKYQYLDLSLIHISEPTRP